MSQQDHNRKIDYVEFPATDIEATKRFYSEVFGWQFQDYGPDYTSFVDGRLAGGFNKAAQPSSRAGERTRSPLIVIYAASLEETFANVKAHGGQNRSGDLRLPGRTPLSLLRSQR